MTIPAAAEEKVVSWRMSNLIQSVSELSFRKGRNYCKSLVETLRWDETNFESFNKELEIQTTNKLNWLILQEINRRYNSCTYWITVESEGRWQAKKWSQMLNAQDSLIKPLTNQNISSLRAMQLQLHTSGGSRINCDLHAYDPTIVIISSCLNGQPMHVAIVQPYRYEACKTEEYKAASKQCEMVKVFFEDLFAHSGHLGDKIPKLSN